MQAPELAFSFRKPADRRLDIQIRTEMEIPNSDASKQEQGHRLASHGLGIGRSLGEFLRQSPELHLLPCTGTGIVQGLFHSENACIN